MSAVSMAVGATVAGKKLGQKYSPTSVRASGPFKKTISQQNKAAMSAKNKATGAKTKQKLPPKAMMGFKGW